MEEDMGVSQVGKKVINMRPDHEDGMKDLDHQDVEIMRSRGFFYQQQPE